MNWKTWAPFAVAVVLGVVAAVAARGVVSGKGHGAAPAAEVGVNVVVIKADVMAGEELKAEHLGMGKLAAATVPAEAFTKVEQLAGRVAQARMIPGQVVLEPLLAPRGSGGGLQALVPEGMRAITIEVSESSGVAGLLVPGCRVDVLATVVGTDQQPIARTMVQDLKVTAVGRRTAPVLGDEKDKEMSRTVTLIASPRDAEVLELLAATGKPRLVLRSTRDTAPVGSAAGTTLSDVRGEPRKDELRGTIFDSGPAVEAVTRGAVPPLSPGTVMVSAEGDDKAAGRTVRVIRGGVETVVKVPEMRERPVMTDTSEPGFPH